HVLPEANERWSLGDLLARASRDDDGTVRAPMLDIEAIAGALDPTTASAIWSRFRAGQRGIMVRSIYTAEGRSSFDQVTERYGRDADFRRTVERFLADFERLVRETEQTSPRAVHDHLVSDAGRVYLFLAHTSGRLRGGPRRPRHQSTAPWRERVVAATQLDADGDARKIESLAQAIGEIAQVGLRQSLRTRAEGDEGGRPRRSLRHEADF